MDFREAKKLIAYAKKSGVKHIKCADFEVTFDESARPFEWASGIINKAKSVAAPADKDTKPSPTPAPTLDEINKFIYEGPNENQ